MKQTNSIDNFIANFTRTMSINLVMNIIKQYGGVELFIKNHKRACYITDEIKGWHDNDSLIEFFTENEKDILEFAEDEAELFEYDNAIDMIADFPCFEGHDSEWILEALKNKGSSEHCRVSVVMAFYVGEELARCYEFFLQDNPIYINTASNVHCDANARLQLTYG